VNLHLASDLLLNKRLPEPEPVPDKAAYLREREACLALSPARRANWERYERSTRREVELDYLPIRLDVENVSRCNFRCTMCQVSDWPKGQRARDMTIWEFKNLLDEQVGVVELKIQGFGEPTMGGESYFGMIRHARAQRIWVRTITNASLLHLRDYYKKLVDSDANEIQISIDGATQEVFEGIRRGSVFERVTTNCALINGYSDGSRTKMWTVVQEANAHQLEDLVALADHMGFRHMVFSFELIDFGQPRWKEANDAVSVSHRIDLDRCWRLHDTAASRGIKLAFWFATERYDAGDPAKLCPWPFERAYVSSDMRFVPCCIIGNPEVSDLGDARRLAEAWNGPAIADFRRAHLDGRVPDVCKSCYKGGGR
jgi:MoaA/NifB/PqqE/SkfB family radical SAM enzyme